MPTEKRNSVGFELTLTYEIGCQPLERDTVTLTGHIYMLTMHNMACFTAPLQGYLLIFGTRRWELEIGARFIFGLPLVFGTQFGIGASIEVGCDLEIGTHRDLEHFIYLSLAIGTNNPSLFGSWWSIGIGMSYYSRDLEPDQSGIGTVIGTRYPSQFGTSGRIGYNG